MMHKHGKMSSCILNEFETGHNLISIRLYFILTILITEDGRLTSSLFIEVPLLSQESERSCICVLEISNLPISTIFLKDQEVHMSLYRSPC
jgi:hypothetical protein